MTADSAIELAGSVDALRSQYRMAWAEEVARASLRDIPESVDVLITSGRAPLATYRAAEALAVFSQAEGQAPGDDRVVTWQVAAQSRQHANEDAMTAGKGALERFLDSVPIRVALGRVYVDSSRPRDALPFLARAVRIGRRSLPADSPYHVVEDQSLVFRVRVRAGA